MNIVCIKDDRSNCEDLDVISMHEDDVELSGNGYSNFHVINVRGNMNTVKAIFNEKIPETKEVDGVEQWFNGTDWLILKERPKYQISLKELTKSDLNRLKTTTEPLSKATEKISLKPNNHDHASLL